MGITKDFINEGLLREVIKFEKNNPTDSDSGGEFEAYTQFLTTRGRLRKKNGSRVLEAGTVLLNSGYELVTRYQEAIANELNSDATIRIVCNNRFFTIDSFDIYEQRFRFFVFQLNEQHI